MLEHQGDEGLRRALLKLADAQRAYADTYGAFKAKGDLGSPGAVQQLGTADRRVEAAWRDILDLDGRR